MKRIFSLSLCIVLLIGTVFMTDAAELSASSAVLMDADSGRVLYAKNEHQPRPIASITKLMTALVALESGHSLAENITISDQWTGVEGSSLYLKPGETISLEALLYGMLLRSGNDAALAVAGSCGGTVDNFVALMNRRADSLGMKNSHFANPNGLNAKEHYSSAYDMALLAQACLHHDVLSKIVSTKSITLGTRNFTNHNKLLWRYPGCIGLKTGYTEAAGRTLVSAAECSGTTLICVTLNDPDDWNDHTALLDMGFRSYQTRTLIDRGETICQLPVRGSLSPFCPVVAQSAIRAALNPEECPEYRVQFDVELLHAPVQSGDKVGILTCSLGDQELGRCFLISARDAPCLLTPERFSWLNWVRQHLP